MDWSAFSLGFLVLVSYWKGIWERRYRLARGNDGAHLIFIRRLAGSAPIACYVLSALRFDRIKDPCFDQRNAGARKPSTLSIFIQLHKRLRAVVNG